MSAAGRDYTAFPHSNVVRLEDYRQVPQALRDRPGYIENRLSTCRETNAWKALAAKHEAARTFINDLVAIGMGPGTWEYAEALDDYKAACALVLAYKDAKPRHLASIIRCAADLAGLPDPAWIDCREKHAGGAGTPDGKFSALLSVIYTRAVHAISRCASSGSRDSDLEPERDSRDPDAD